MKRINLSTLEKLTYNGKEVKQVFFNGRHVWSKYPKVKYKHTLAGNWKMNKTDSETKAYFQNFNVNVPDDAELVLFPPFTSLVTAMESRLSDKIRIGAQDISENVKGAYTGQVSGAMLKDIGIRYVLIGTSERRDFYGDTDEICAVKVKRALENDLIPFYYVGESYAQHNNNESFQAVQAQLEALYTSVNLSDADIRIVYEPIWAVGTGQTCTADYAQEMCAFIRSFSGECVNPVFAESLPILYGGGFYMNIDAIAGQKDINGACIANPSLTYEKFLPYLNAFLK